MSLPQAMFEAGIRYEIDRVLGEAMDICMKDKEHIEKFQNIFGGMYEVRVNLATINKDGTIRHTEVEPVMFNTNKVCRCMTCEEL